MKRLERNITWKKSGYIAIKRINENMFSFILIVFLISISIHTHRRMYSYEVNPSNVNWYFQLSHINYTYWDIVWTQSWIMLYFLSSMLVCFFWSLCSVLSRDEYTCIDQQEYKWSGQRIPQSASLSWLITLARTKNYCAWFNTILSKYALGIDKLCVI